MIGIVDCVQGKLRNLLSMRERRKTTWNKIWTIRRMTVKKIQTSAQVEKNLLPYIRAVPVRYPELKKEVWMIAICRFCVGLGFHASWLFVYLVSRYGTWYCISRWIRMWIRILIFVWCGSRSIFHPDTEPDPDHIRLNPWKRAQIGS